MNYLQKSLTQILILQWKEHVHISFLRDLSTLFPDVHFVDPVEQYRLDKVSDLKRRGKGAPKKAKKGDAAPKKGKGKK